MTTKTDDIKLPPLPAVPAADHYSSTIVVTLEQAEDAIRAAVEADRQRRVPSVEELDDLSDEFHGYSGNHTRDGYLIPKFDYIGYARALLSRYSSGQPAASAEPCPICFEDEPHTGTCGSSNPRALCNQPAAPVAQEPVGVSSLGQSDAAFNRWYESKFKPAMERGPFDKYVARQAWYAALRDALPAAPVAQEPIHQYRVRNCSDWYDGLPDTSDGKDYETRTLYAAPVAQKPVAKAAMPTYCVACGLISAESMPCAYLDEHRPGCLLLAQLAAPVAQELVAYCGEGLKPLYPDELERLRQREPGTAALYDTPLFRRAAPVAAQAQPTMPALTDAMRAVLRNEHDVYGDEDALYAALCDAAQAQPTMDDAIAAAGDGTLHGAIDYWQDRARKAEAAQAQLNAPDGWKLVPVEPTDEMIAATYTDRASKQTRRHDAGFRAGVIRKAIAASPTPPSAQVDESANLQGLAHRIDDDDLDRVATILNRHEAEEIGLWGVVEEIMDAFGARFYPSAQDREDAQTQAARDVLAERQRQISAEGWTPEHDDMHPYGVIAKAASCYATGNPRGWPWREDWWKPKTQRRNLVRAGALILAEIERLDRAAARAAKGQS